MTNRVPAGVPTGGQFAAGARARSTVSLDTDLFGEPAGHEVEVSRDYREVMAGQDLAYANLGNHDLPDVDLREANLTHANLDGANLSRADLRGANLRNASLHGAELSDANFAGAIMTGSEVSTYSVDSDFTGADMSNARVLTGATRVDFSDVDFSGATLSGHFEDCDFTGADFSDANLAGRHHAGSDGSGRVVHAFGEATFVNCRFDTHFDADDFGSASFPTGFDPARDARFREYGFTDSETANWVDVGWTGGAAEAAAWKNYGYDAETAVQGQLDAGIDASSYHAYRTLAGIEDPYTAKNWSDSCILAEDVKAWRDQDFAVGSYLDIGEDAGRWADQDFTPAVAKTWAEKRYGPHEAAGHIAAGHTPENAPEPVLLRTRREHEQSLIGVPVATLRRMDVEADRATKSEGLSEIEQQQASARLGAVRAAMRAASRRR